MVLYRLVEKNKSVMNELKKSHSLQPNGYRFTSKEKKYLFTI